jgi:hypothetical protein
MLHRVAVSCFALLPLAGAAAALPGPDGTPPIEPGGRFLLVLILAGAGLLAVRKERR